MTARLLKTNYRSVIVTAGAGWASRIVTALAQLASIRLLISMLGIDGYGAFAVITGLLGWFALADFGFGPGLQNYISERRVAGESAFDAIVGVTQALAISTVALCIIYLTTAWFAGPLLLEKFGSVSHHDAALGWLTFAMLATGTGAAAIYLRVCFAEHRGYVAHGVSTVGAVMGLAGIAILGRTDILDKFAWAMFLFSAPNCFVPIILLGRYLIRNAAGSHCNLLRPNWPILRDIWKRARVFLLFNSLTASVLYIDYIVLSQTMGARDAATYAVFAKIFMLAFFVFNSVIQAYWPVSAEIFHRGELGGLRRLVLICLAFGTTVVLGASATIYLLAGPIAHILSPGRQLELPMKLIPFFALYWTVRVWCDTFSMLIQSAGRANLLCYIVPVQAAVNFVLSYWGATMFGLSGLLLGMTAAFLLTVAWVVPAMLVYIMKKPAA